MRGYALVGTMVLALVVSACTTVPPSGASAVAEVGSGMVSACHLLGTVHGSSLMDGVLQAKGVQSAKNEAMDEAAQWGASAIVWTQITQRYWGAEMVTGSAYRCPHNIKHAAFQVIP